VLVNTLGKIPADLFSEFEGKHAHELSSGDVKYHQGFSSDIQTPGGAVHLTLAFNPSHLEIVNPVVEGSVRARSIATAITRAMPFCRSSSTATRHSRGRASSWKRSRFRRRAATRPAAPCTSW
jgi:2-oxoglutarate dehydrogenase complex dehydrogenase (E1) component-like enzyme